MYDLLNLSTKLIANLVFSKPISKYMRPYMIQFLKVSFKKDKKCPVKGRGSLHKSYGSFGSFLIPVLESNTVPGFLVLPDGIIAGVC